MSMSNSAAINSWENAGYNAAAGNLLISALADPDFSSAFYAAAGAATGRPTDSAGNVAPVASLTWNEGGISRVTDMPATLAAELSSVLNQAAYFQTGGKGLMPKATTNRGTLTSGTGLTEPSMTRTTSAMSATMSTQSQSSNPASSTGRSSSFSTSSMTTSSLAAPLPAAASASSSVTPQGSTNSGPNSSITAVAIAVPVVVVALLLLGLAFYLMRRSKKSSSIASSPLRQETAREDPEFGGGVGGPKMEIQSVETSPRSPQMTVRSARSSGRAIVREPQAFL